MKKSLLICIGLFLSSLSSFAQNCGNMGFENGNTSGWTCRSGTYASTNPMTCGPADGPTNLASTGCINAGGNNAPTTGVNDRHVLMSQAGTDPNSLNNVTYVAPGSMFPTGTNSYSFRLGNGQAGGINGLAMAESVEFSFLVTQQNAGFTYMYSVFLMDPSHKTWESPRFEIRITRKVNGKDSLIDCGKYKVIAGVGTSAWKTGATDPVAQAPWKYTDWTKVGLDLTGFIGQTVTIQFITSDCFPASGTSTTCTNGICNTTCTASPGTHSSYAYIDAYCVPLQIDAPTICSNQSTLQICAPPGYQTYNWPSGQPGVTGALNGQCVTINNPNAGTTYTVNMTSVAGGCPTSTTVTLKGFDFTVNDTLVCKGTSPFKLNVTPTVPGTYNYTWTPATNLSCTNCEDPTFTPNATQTYTVIMKDATQGCSKTKTVTVTVNNATGVTASGATICQGSSAPISAVGNSCSPGAGTYSWAPSTGLTPTNTATVTASPTATTTYTVTYTDAGGSKVTATAIVVVNPMPTLSTNNPSICAGQTTTITAGTANSYLWSNGATTASITVNPTVTTTYTLTGINTGGCSSKITAVVTVNPMPTVTVNSVTICKGALSPLTATGANSYTWSPAIGLSATTGATVNASPPADQSYVIMAVTNAGCTGSATASVKVNNCMFVVAHDTTICAGQCAILKATASVGNAPYTYTWSGGNPDLGTVCPLTTTDYTVVATDQNGNSASDILTVTIQSTPIITATPVATCIGTCATLTASGAATYTWSPAIGLNTVNGNSVTACNLTTNQTYLITGSTSAGCTNTSTVTVTINPLPTITAPPAIVCKGVPATLVASGATNYSWTPATGLDKTTGSTVIANPTTSTVYTIVGKDGNGCTNSVTTNVLVNLPPTISGNSPSICVSDSATLNAFGASTYTWSPSATLSSSTGNSVVASPPSSTVYLIVGTDNNGCTGSTNVRVSVDPTPVLTASSSTICIGLSTTLTVSGANTYNWSPPVNITPTTGNTVVATPTTTTVYTIIGTSAAGCTESMQVTVVVNGKPNIRAQGDTICMRDPATLTAQGGVKYTWQPGNLPGTPITNISPGTTTTYTVIGEDANGCTNTATALILVKVVPVADFTPDPQTVSIEAPTINFHNNSINGKTYAWDFGDSSTDTTFHTKHTYDNPGKYNVCLTVENDGCAANVCKEIVITPEWTFYVPNAFSPNGDGLNDGFIGKGTNILEFEMWIFDRWGNMIYHCKDMSKPWDGRRDNDPSQEIAQEDVYVWKIKIKDVFEKKHSYLGHVTLVK